MTGEQVALAAFAIGLVLGVVCTLILTPHRRRRQRRRKRGVRPVGAQEVTGDLDLAHATPEQAMAHAAPADTPAETARLDVTAQIPQLETIAIGAPPTEPVALPAVTEPWRPPEPRVVLTLTWKREHAPLVAGRWDITEWQPPDDIPVPEEAAELYIAMRRQREYDGGTIAVAVKLDGRHTPDWEWTANDGWPPQSIEAIRQALNDLKVGADA